MLKDYEDSISLILRTRSSRKPLGMQEEIGNTNGSSHALQDTARKASMVRPAARLMISSLNLRVYWKPVNPQECVWKNLYQNIMRTTLQERGQFTTASQFGTQIYSYASSNEDTRSKSSSGQRMGETSEKIPAWDITKVRNKSEVIHDGRSKGRKVHFASLMDICHLKNAALETRHQKF